MESQYFPGLVGCCRGTVESCTNLYRPGYHGGVARRHGVPVQTDAVFQTDAVYADGRREEVDVSEPVLIEIRGRKVYEECLILGDEVLVGQTALEKTDLQVDCRSRTLRPNPKHPDRPVMPVRASFAAGNAGVSL